MKDLDPARQILGMQILHDRKVKKLWFSQEKYIEQVLERFNIKHAKPVNTPLSVHFKLRKKSCSLSKKEKKDIASTINSSAVRSWEFDVCYGLHTTKYCSLNWCCQ